MIIMKPNLSSYRIKTIFANLTDGSYYDASIELIFDNYKKEIYSIEM